MAALEVIKTIKESLSRRPIVGTKHQVELSFTAPKAKKVCIAGDFNDWNMTLMSLKKERRRNLEDQTWLSPGKYEYKFIVDGMWAQDMSCSEAGAESVRHM